jgi:hypothetical protein
LHRGVIGASEAVEQVFQNKLGTALAILTAERQRVTTRETMRGPHRDKEQRDRLREIATLQIVLTVLKRPPGNNEGGPEEQSRTRDRVWRKIQSWDVIRRLDMIAPEIINPAVSHLLPSSSLDLLAQLVQRWKDWKMSEVDDIIQTQSRTNHSQEWTKQRRTFLEEKHRLSLLTGKRKPNVPQVELLEEVPIGVIKLLEMTVVGTHRADKPIIFPQEKYPRTTSSTTWDEAHLSRLIGPKGKADHVNKIVTTAIGVWGKKSLVRQEIVLRERRAGEEETRLRLRYDGGVGDHGSEDFRVQGERWWISRSHSGFVSLLEWVRLIQQTTDKENRELGVIVWGISELQEPATTSTI